MATKSAKKKSADTAPSLISNAKLQQLYATMLQCRILDSYARSLNGGASWKGKEAAAVGATIDLGPEDAIVFSSGAAVAGFLKGVPLGSIFRQSSRRSSLPAKKQPKTGAGAKATAQGALATGIAYARSTGSKGNITVAFLSQHAEECEADRNALQFAGAHKLPLVYVFSGEPVDMTQMYRYGFPVIPVDGGDVVAVYRVAYECMTRARQGGGPSVIACSFASGNGSMAKSQDPLNNMEKYLSAKGLFMNGQKEATIRAFEKAIAAARKRPQRQETEQESQHIFAV